MPKTAGTVLNDLLNKNNKALANAAREMKIPYSSLAQIGKGKVNLSVPMALRFAKYFGTTPNFWIELQISVEMGKAKADKKLSKDLADIKKIKPDPVETKKDAPKKPVKAGAKRGRKAAVAKTSKPKAAAPRKAKTDEKAKPSAPSNGGLSLSPSVLSEIRITEADLLRLGVRSSPVTVNPKYRKLAQNCLSKKF